MNVFITVLLMLLVILGLFLISYITSYIITKYNYLNNYVWILVNEEIINKRKLKHRTGTTKIIPKKAESLIVTKEVSGKYREYRFKNPKPKLDYKDLINCWVVYEIIDKSVATESKYRLGYCTEYNKSINCIGINESHSFPPSKKEIVMKRRLYWLYYVKIPTNSFYRTKQIKIHCYNFNPNYKLI